MARAIFDTLREIRAGALLDEASSSLAEVVLAVQQTGKAGKVSIVVDLKPPARGSSRTIVLDAEVVSKVPKPDREVSVFFPTADGSLTKTDPAQRQLDLKLADPPPLPAGMRVNTETGEILAS
jgi:hypothetical protein